MYVYYSLPPILREVMAMLRIGGRGMVRIWERQESELEKSGMHIKVVSCTLISPLSLQQYNTVARVTRISSEHF